MVENVVTVCNINMWASFLPIRGREAAELSKYVARLDAIMMPNYFQA